MEIITCIRPGLLKYGVRKKPILKTGHSIIKIKRIGICGTDLHAFEGTQPYFNYPRILGHELSGELVAIDNAPGFLVNEKVTFTPYFNCGHCIACRSGNSNCCMNLNVCGVHVDGGMAEFLMVPSHTLIHGGSLSFDELALIEPFSIGAHGVRRAAVMAKEFVLVIGAGPIGLGAMEFANIRGAKVIAMDVNEERLRFCRDKINVAYTINASSTNSLKQLTDITHGDLASVVIDATGNLNAINNAFQYIAHGGRFILIGLQKGNISFSHPEFHKREATLMSSRNATDHDFYYVIDCIKKGLINPLNYITHKVGFEEAQTAFSSWLNSEDNLIKAMISMDSIPY